MDITERLNDPELYMDAADDAIAAIQSLRAKLSESKQHVELLERALGNASDEAADLAHQLTIFEQNLDEDRAEANRWFHKCEHLKSELFHVRCDLAAKRAQFDAYRQMMFMADIVVPSVVDAKDGNDRIARG